MRKQKCLSAALLISALIGLTASVFCGLTSCTSQPGSEIIPGTISFDEGWKFIKDSVSGAENPGFHDSDWRTLDVPHDWSIEDLPGQNGVDIIGPFDKSAVDKMSSGYTVGGTGWYRKSFTVNEEDKNKIIYVQFDGIYMNSDVWLNGKHLGFHPYGYTPFYYNITSFLNPAGQKNVVAVRVRNEGLNSRWYSGSGITRHVWLTTVNPVHVDIAGGIHVTTPEVNETLAGVKLVTTILNSGTSDENFVLQTNLFDPSGKQAGSVSTDSRLASGQTIEIIQNIPVNKPALWSIDNPNLYQAEATIIIDGKTVDNQKVSFGIRSIKIDARNGLTINGKPLDMIGGCYQFNAIRTSHNPPSPALLDACDRLGMVVIDEIFDMWEYPKKEEDYHLYFKEWWQKDVESWVKRDRNHPSVILWSIGNEIHETFDTTGLRIAKNLTGEIRRVDQTRGITEAFNDFAARRGLKSKWDEIPEHMDLLDVVGYNYMYSRYEEDHIKYPERVMVGTETNPPLALENWQLVEKHPYVIGYFVWTATDNLGEAGVGMPQLRDIEPENNQPPINPPGGAVPAIRQGPPPTIVPGQPAGMPGGGFFRRDTWPVFTNYQGDIDLIGNRKVPSYYQYVVWGKSKVEMFVHRPVPEGKREVTSRWGFPDELKSWNWEGHEGMKFQVHVYSRLWENKM
jgi:beta-galactosidase